MKLSFETIRSVTVGAVSILQEESCIHFACRTPKQIAVWNQIRSDFRHLTNCTTGIRLDFYTNSRTVRFVSASGGHFELLIDGQLRKVFAFSDELAENEGSFQIADARGVHQGAHRVTLMLPNYNAPGVLKFVELEEGSWVKPHTFDRKILFLGDSITQGFDSDVDSDSYAMLVSRLLNAESVVNGLGGAIYHTSTFDSIPFEPDWVILAYGTNDFHYYSTLQQMQTEVSGYLDLIGKEYAGKRIVVISPLWRAQASGECMGTDFAARRKMIESEAKSRGFEAVCGLEMIPPLGEFFADQYLHPNRLGHIVFGQNLYKYLLKGMYR